MDGHHIRLLRSPEDHTIIQTRAARNARIDALGVDRSRFKVMPIWHWSPEADKGEEKPRIVRAEVTFDEQLAAWRQIVALPKVKK